MKNRIVELQLKSSIPFQKNNDCSSALLDLMEYYDTVIPVYIL